ncbi:MAG TPA: hypothetical protein VFB14_23955 [Bryobacteraceae bacterium]|nr:hypothetical protein [Bryobacteraceae bacterium]
MPPRILVLLGIAFAIRSPAAAQSASASASPKTQTMEEVQRIAAAALQKAQANGDDAAASFLRISKTLYALNALIAQGAPHTGNAAADADLEGKRRTALDRHIKLLINQLLKERQTPMEPQALDIVRAIGGEDAINNYQAANGIHGQVPSGPPVRTPAGGAAQARLVQNLTSGVLEITPARISSLPEHNPSLKLPSGPMPPFEDQYRAIEAVSTSAAATLLAVQSVASEPAEKNNWDGNMIIAAQNAALEWGRMLFSMQIAIDLIKLHDENPTAANAAVDQLLNVKNGNPGNANAAAKVKLRLTQTTLGTAVLGSIAATGEIGGAIAGMTAATLDNSGNVLAPVAALFPLATPESVFSRSEPPAPVPPPLTAAAFVPYPRPLRSDPPHPFLHRVRRFLHRMFASRTAAPLLSASV